MNTDQPTAFDAPRTIKDFNGQSGTVSYGLDDKLIAAFYIKPYYMEYLSEVHGAPIYQDRIYVRIVAPGNSKTVWDTFACGVTYETAVDPNTGEYFTEWTELERMPNGDRTDMQKYPNAWAAFRKRGEVPKIGFPIEEWGAISRSMAESLKMLGVPTVEAMAGLSDANAQNIMGGFKFRELAKAYLDDKQRNEIVAREQTRADRLDGEITQMRNQNQALSDQLAAMQEQFNALAAGGVSLQPRVEGQPAPQQRTPAFKSRKAPTSARTKAILDRATKSTDQAA